MKSIIIALLVLFGVLQYQLWFGSGGMFSAWELRHKIEHQKQINLSDKKRNQQIQMDIQALKHGHHALEERARADLGMVKKDETFYQVVKGDDKNS